MHRIQKLLKVGDTVFSAGGKPIEVKSVGALGFDTEFGYFLYDEVRTLYFLTKTGYEYAKKQKRRNDNGKKNI